MRFIGTVVGGSFKSEDLMYDHLKGINHDIFLVSVFDNDSLKTEQFCSVFRHNVLKTEQNCSVFWTKWLKICFSYSSQTRLQTYGTSKITMIDNIWTKNKTF